MRHLSATAVCFVIAFCSMAASAETTSARINTVGQAAPRPLPDSGSLRSVSEKGQTKTDSFDLFVPFFRVDTSNPGGLTRISHQA